MKTKLTTLFILLTALVIKTEARESLAYHVKTGKGFCTSTLIKVDNVCKMITNAHCLKDSDKSVSITSQTSYFNLLKETSKETSTLVNSFDPLANGLTKEEIEVQERNFGVSNHGSYQHFNITHIDRTKDMAYIDIGQHHFQKDCNKLNNIKKDREIERTIDGDIALSGFTRERVDRAPIPKVWSSNKPTVRIIDTFYDLAPSTNKTTRIKATPSTLEQVDNFILLENTKILPGNSGGTANDENGNLIGITTRFHPSQDEVYVIPKNEVIKFAKNPTQDLEEFSFDNGTYYIGGNSLTGGGGNSLTGGGGNSLTGGGGNSLTGGGGSDCYSKEMLSFFTEPQEGVLLDIGRVLLAANEQQIDGTDDYKQHYPSATSIVLRDEDGFPLYDIRKDMLTRIQGQYSFKQSKSKLLREDERLVLKQDELSRGETTTNIEVTATNIKIKIKEHSTEYNVLKFNTEDKVDELSFDFKITSDASKKNIYLTDGNTKLTCKNDNYLKLICNNKDYHFSISKKSTKPDSETSFRMIKKLNNNYSRYMYGKNQ